MYFLKIFLQEMGSIQKCVIIYFIFKKYFMFCFLESILFYNYFMGGKNCV